jgi:hypothetical protein
MIQQDLAIDLLDQDVQVESGLLPPGSFAVQPRGLSGHPTSDIDPHKIQQDLAIGLLDQDVQVESGLLPPA